MNPDGAGGWSLRSTVAGMGWEGRVLLLVGAVFFLGTYLSFEAHLRLGNTVYPLWMLLGINAVIATVGGAFAVLGGDSGEGEWSVSPDSVVVPARVWEEMQRKLSVSRGAAEPTFRTAATGSGGSKVDGALVATRPASPLQVSSAMSPARSAASTGTAPIVPPWSEADEPLPARVLGSGATLESITQELEDLAREVSANASPPRPTGRNPEIAENERAPRSPSPELQVAASVGGTGARGPRSAPVENVPPPPAPHRGPLEGRCGSCDTTLGPTSIDARCDVCGRPMCWKCARMAEVQDNPGRCSKCLALPPTGGKK